MYRKKLFQLFERFCDNISYCIDNIIPNLPKQKAEKFYELLKKFSYRTFMNSMDDEFMDKIQEIRKSPD